MSTFKIGEKKERLRSVKIGKLTTVMEVAAELGRVYRDARCERIDSSLANRLANILCAMRQCLETAEFERRIAEIEAASRSVRPLASVRLDAIRRPTDDDSLPGSDRLIAGTRPCTHKNRRIGDAW